MLTKKRFLNFLCFLSFSLFLFSCENKTKNETKIETKLSNKVYKTISYNNSNAIIADDSSSCEAAKVKAKNDYKQNKLKYYAFGIVTPSKKFITILKEQYNIETIVGGCSVTPGADCYNDEVNHILFAKSGKYLGQLRDEY